MEFFQKGLTPLPPRLLELLGHFLQTFGTFGTLSRKVSQKSFKKVLYTKSVPKNFWIASEPPPPLLEEFHNKAAFFLWEAPLSIQYICQYPFWCLCWTQIGGIILPQ